MSHGLLDMEELKVEKKDCFFTEKNCGTEKYALRIELLAQSQYESQSRALDAYFDVSWRVPAQRQIPCVPEITCN